MPECRACLFIGDDNGDGTATMTCQLPFGHPGHHVEKFERPADQEPNRVFVSWTLDEREKCYHCERWEHEHGWRHPENKCPRFRADHDSDNCAVCLAERRKYDDESLS